MFRQKFLFKGQTLLGLMVALALSSFLFLAIADFYTKTQLQNQQVLLKLKLQAELQRTIQLIGKDLRRTGFRALNEKLQSSNFSLFELDEQGTSIRIAQANNAPANSCVLFFYDLYIDGCVGDKYTSNQCVKEGKNVGKNIEKELFGYKLNGKMIETKSTYKTAVNTQCVSSECQRHLDQSVCNAGGGWTDLLDETEYEITQLAFNWLAEHQGIEVKLAGRLKQYANIQYATTMIVPLLNQMQSKQEGKNE